jgi:tetratricopeptide (TPR) repeat protein
MATGFGLWCGPKLEVLVDEVPNRIQALLERAEGLSDDLTHPGRARLLLFEVVRLTPQIQPPPGFSREVDNFRFEVDIRVAKLARELGEWDVARTHFERVQAWLRPSNDVFWLAEEAWICTVLAGLHLDAGEEKRMAARLFRAVDRLERAVALSEDPENLRFCLNIAEAAEELAQLFADDDELVDRIGKTLTDIGKKLTPRLV